MAKMKEGTSTALVEVTETEKQLQALQAAGIDLADQSGKEDIDTRNLVLPFLAICQKTSPQLESDNAKYIDGLKFGDLFNSLTGQIFDGPVEFIPIRLKEHAIEFTPFDEGGGIKDRNVPLDDPRCAFQGDEKPLATVFLDFAVLVLPDLVPMVLSFKSTSLKMGYVLKTLIKTSKVPIYAQRFRVSTSSAKNSYGTFAVLGVKPTGLATPEQAEYAKATIESWRSKNIVIEHEVEQDDEPTTPAKDEKLPF